MSCVEKCGEVSESTPGLEILFCRKEPDVMASFSNSFVQYLSFRSFASGHNPRRELSLREILFPMTIFALGVCPKMRKG